MSDHAHFNPQKIFVTLFVLTMAEVAWGKFMPYEQKALLWGGLLIFAFWKGLLIFMYFMHMKFEGWVCKALIAPTPVMVAIVVFAIMPDVAHNGDLIRPVGDQYDPVQGTVVSVGMSTGDPKFQHRFVGPDGNLMEKDEDGATVVVAMPVDPLEDGAWFVAADGRRFDREGRELGGASSGH